MEERQILRAFLVMFMVLMAYYVIFPPRAPQKKPPVPRATPEAPAVPPRAEAPQAPSASAPTASAPVARVAADEEYRVEVETPQFLAAFKNRGARLVSWKLTHYRDAKGDPEEMVHTTAEGPLPFDVDTGDTAVNTRLREALFKASSREVKLSRTEESSVVFEFADGDLSARKEFWFRGDGYLVKVATSVQQGGRELPRKVLWGPGLGHASAAERSLRDYAEPHGVALVNGKAVQTAAAKIGDGVTYNELRWIGVEARHFVALWVPAQDRGAGELHQVELPGVGPDAKPHPATLASVAQGASTEPALLYVGPKDYYILSHVGHDLVRAVPLGDWIGPIVIFMMNVLRWLHAHLGNYGWSIVALTAVISLIMAPLRHYGIVNGRKMAKMSPEMKVIQERYRKVPFDKRQDMQKEMAALYEKHGMNMMGQMLVGCLPLLITMPFLFAVYRVLNVSIDLRGAGFLWIPDLSYRDPLFVTPILMAVSMFLMQKLTPTTMEPAQQRMMMIMPIVLVGFVSAAPAGLNLYWFVSNLCSIIQQVVTLKLLAAREEAAGATAPAKRRRR